jgi:hypothetical protein
MQVPLKITVCILQHSAVYKDSMTKELQFQPVEARHWSANVVTETQFLPIYIKITQKINFGLLAT